MRRERLSRYSAYSAWSLSQQFLESARDPLCALLIPPVSGRRWEREGVVWEV